MSMDMSKFATADRVADATASIWLDLFRYGVITSLWNYSRVEFTALAVETKSVNLGQGFPDYPVPARITEALSKIAHVNDGEPGLQHQYIRPYVGSLHVWVEILCINLC